MLFEFDTADVWPFYHVVVETGEFNSAKPVIMHIKIALSDNTIQ